MSDKFTDDDWLTPPGLVKLLGQFDTDPCSPHHRPWDTAKVHFNQLQDGLRQEWRGRVWLNPPYSKIAPWVEKMARHNSGMALVNAKTETRWFQSGIWNAANAVFFFQGRIRFFRPDGQPGPDDNRSPSCLAAYSATDAGILYRAGLAGKFVPLVLQLAEIKTPWRNLTRFLLVQCRGRASLDELYGLAADHPKTQANQHWKAKIRQQVQQQADRIGPGLWQAKTET